MVVHPVGLPLPIVAMAASLATEPAAPTLLLHRVLSRQMVVVERNLETRSAKGANTETVARNMGI